MPRVPIEVTWEIALPRWSQKHGRPAKTDAEWAEAWKDAEAWLKQKPAHRSASVSETVRKRRRAPDSRTCLECGVSFDPAGTKRLYHDDACAQRARNKKRPKKETRLDRVIAAVGRKCSNCRYEGPGKRWPFWHDDDDRIDENMATAMILCAKCHPRLARQRAMERKREQNEELRAEMHGIRTIPF